MAADLPGTLEVPTGLLRVLAEGKEVQVVRKADRNKASLVTELCVEAGGIEEEENRRER
jgi:hypothetical protein